MRKPWNISARTRTTCFNITTTELGKQLWPAIYQRGTGRHYGTTPFCRELAFRGVDCLSTIYTHYETEQHEEDRINALFMTNFATDKDVKKRDLYRERCKAMKKIADALGLPFYEVDCNFDSFLQLGDRCSYFALYSCAFALERALGKYYISSSLSYREILKWHNNSYNRDWSEFADSYAIPLMASKGLKLISDGCQYSRSEKTELISDWEIAQKYLYVCSGKKSTVNCCESLT